MRTLRRRRPAAPGLSSARAKRGAMAPERRAIGGVALAVAIGIATPASAGAQQPTRQAQQPTKQTPPAALPARPLAFPPFRELALKNGLKLIVVQRHDLPIASVRLYVRAGTAADPAGQAGLATLVAELATKGTQQRTAREISALVEGAGGNLSSDAGSDYASISCSMLAEKLPLAFEVVSDAARRASFPADELETARKRLLSSLQMELSQPASVASRIMDAKLYGEMSPYGVAPTPASVQALTRAELEAFYRDRYRAGNALLVVAGDVDVGRIETLARKYFGDWSAGAPAPVALPTPPSYGRTTIFLVQRPASVQSNILVGTTTMAPGAADYHPLEVGTQILGGGPDSRLFMILREQKSWTYGAYARIARPRLLGSFMANTEVRTAVTDSALAEMLTQIRRLANEPAPAPDMGAAKGFMAGSFPLRLQTASQIAGQIARVRLLGLPISELTRYPQKVEAVTPAEVERVARKYLDPQRLIVVVVGDAPKLMAPLEKIAPVTLLDVEGKPLDAASLEVKSSAIPLDGSLLKPMTATYDFLVQGNPFGTLTTTLAREGDLWVAKQKLTSATMSQQGELRMKAADLTPQSVTQSSTVGGTTFNSDLKLAGGKVTGTAALPPQAGGNKTFDTPAPAGTLLPGTVGFALAVLPLEVGRTITLPVFSVRSGTVENESYKVAAEEKVTVPAGAMDCYRIEVSGAQPRTEWVRKQLPHILIKQEMTGAPVVIELKSLQ